MSAARHDSGMGEADSSTERASVSSHAMFLQLLTAEIGANATEAQLEGFFCAVGRRIPALGPLGQADDLDSMADVMNAIWRRLGWGEVSLDADETGIVIRHRDMPVTFGMDPSLWSLAGPHLLQGAYDGWFRSLGSGAQLTTRIVGTGIGLVELHHGI